MSELNLNAIAKAIIRFTKLCPICSGRKVQKIDNSLIVACMNCNSTGLVCRFCNFHSNTHHYVSMPKSICTNRYHSLNMGGSTVGILEARIVQPPVQSP